MATRWINKGPTAEGTGNAHGFSANDDGVIIHHNGEMFGVINSDKYWGVGSGGARPAPPYASGATFVAKTATPVDLQLPPTKLGFKYTLFIAVAGAHKITPRATDQIIGKADGQAYTGAAVGDSITVVGDGDLGWMVVAKTGTWS